MSGSSPLTRGKRRPIASRAQQLGLIPAHAGKTPVSQPDPSLSRAHPRSRGENQLVLMGLPAAEGSSPLTRGKRFSTRHTSPRGGLIPAHAGKTGCAVLLPVPPWAHPRSRGENGALCDGGATEVGSSPLTRGKLFRGLLALGCHRLIPAHAGKTARTFAVVGATTAHPRSRGENSRRPHKRTMFLGSSPLTRGKQVGVVPGGAEVGLIPAHAGKTPAALTLSCRRRAHPRSRGENHTGRWAGRGLQGSSPLTRGKLRFAHNAQFERGLIPAHAGKTPDRRDPRRHRRAHPRSRGEN